MKLKSDTSLEDWLAVHVVDFMNRIDLLYGLVKDACTFDSCPKMTGGQKYEYKWADDGDYRVNNKVFLLVYYRLSIITSKVCQIISVTKT